MSDIFNLAMRLGITTTEAAAKLGHGVYGAAGGDPSVMGEYYMDRARVIAARDGITIDEAVARAKNGDK